MNNICYWRLLLVIAVNGFGLDVGRRTEAAEVSSEFEVRKSDDDVPVLTTGTGRNSQLDEGRPEGEKKAFLTK